MMQVWKNQSSGTTQVTLESHELALIGKSLFDQQIMYKKFLEHPDDYTKEQLQRYREILKQLQDISDSLGTVKFAI